KDLAAREAETGRRAYAMTQQQIQAAQAELRTFEERMGPLRELADTEKRLKALQAELRSVEEAIEVQSFGLYRPRYSFVSSKDYKAKLDDIWERQKQLVKSGEAAVCPTEWTV